MVGGIRSIMDFMDSVDDRLHTCHALGTDCVAETMKKLLITGSRLWTDLDTMEQALAHAYVDLGGPLTRERGGVVLLSGNARGADHMAEQVWQDKVGELWISRLPAEYHPTPLARNDHMLSLEPDLVLAFPTDCTTPLCPQIGAYGVSHYSHGTAYTISAAQRRNIPVRVFTSAR